MSVTITAEVQSDLRVLLVVDGLSDESPPLDRITGVRRIAYTSDPVFSGLVRGTEDLETVSDPFVVVDQEAPFGATIAYVVSWIRTDRSVGTARSNEVRVEAPYPRFSDPLTGEFVEFTVEQWPTIEYDFGTVILEVHDGDPVVIPGRISAGSSTMQLRFDPHNAGGPRYFRQLLADGRVMLLRAPCATVEGYFAIKSLNESRLTQNAADPRRRVALQVTAVTPPDTYIASALPTLQDLHDFEPGTLADIASTFPTLRDIAVADLGG